VLVCSLGTNDTRRRWNERWNERLERCLCRRRRKFENRIGATRVVVVGGVGTSVGGEAKPSDEALDFVVVRARGTVERGRRTRWTFARKDADDHDVRDDDAETSLDDGHDGV